MNKPSNNITLSNKKIACQIALGIITSISFMIIGYYINGDLDRSATPTFQNEITKILTIFFIGLISGYNLTMSFKDKTNLYWFQSGLFIPIFLLVMLESLIASDILPAILITLGLLIPILSFYSELIDRNEFFEKFLGFFARFIPTIFIFSVVFNDYGIPYLELSINYELGLYGYIPSLVLSFICFGILRYFKQEFESRSERRY